MSNSIECRHCGGQVLTPPSLSGLIVSCPHCELPLTMPTHGALVSAPPPPPAPLAQVQQPVIFVTPREEPQRPIRPTGWFSRGFASTSGVLLALFLFFVVLPISVGVIIRLMGATPVQQYERSADELRQSARVWLKPHLAKHGIKSLAKDVKVRVRDDRIYIAGAGLDRDGNLHEVTAVLWQAQFDDHVRVELEGLWIDEELCESYSPGAGEAVVSDRRT